MPIFRLIIVFRSIDLKKTKNEFIKISVSIVFNKEQRMSTAAFQAPPPALSTPALQAPPPALSTPAFQAPPPALSTPALQAPPPAGEMGRRLF